MLTAHFSITSTPDTEPDVVELKDPAQKIKLLAIRLPRTAVTCAGGIDGSVLKKVLDLSIKTAVAAKPESLLEAVMSANYLNFTAEVFFE